MARRKASVGITTAPDLPDNTDFLFEGQEVVEDEALLDATTEAPVESADAEPVVDQPQAEEGTESEPPHQAATDPNERAIAGLRNEMIQWRRTAKEYQNQLLERDHRQKVLSERLDKLNERWDKAEAPAPPDPSTDPANYIVGEVDKRFNAFREEQAAKEREREEAAAAASHRDNFIRGVANVEAQFAQANPDYYDAIAHLRTARANELYGLGVPEHEIPQIVAQEAVQFAAWSAQNGMNPAEAAYRSALARGYVQRAPGAQEQAPVVHQQANPGVARMQTIARGAAASRSLSNAQGGSGKRAITLDDLANMNDKDFDRIAEDPRLWEAINRGEAVYL